MPKDYFQGITPPASAPSPAAPAERSIRNISITPRKERPDSAPPQRSGPPASMDASSENSKVFKKLLPWILAVVAIAGATVAVVWMMQGTTVIIEPRTHSVVLGEDVTITAYPADKVPEGLLAFTQTTKEFTEERTVVAKGFSEVEEFANGIVTIYNESSATPLRLIKNTRFESPQGLIFRIKDSVIVPGKKENSPGTITAHVYAEQPGDKYNIKPTDRFTLPGLKGGTPGVFEKVYARSSIAFSGGFVGSRPKVDPATLESTRRDMRSALEAKVIAGQTVAGEGSTVVFPTLSTISFTSAEPTRVLDGSVVLKETAIANTPTFLEKDFARALALASKAESDPQGDIRFKTLDTLEVRRIALTETATDAPLDLVVSGSAVLMWHIEPAVVAKTLAGTSKHSFTEAIKSIEGAVRGDASLRPRWKSTFPQDPSKIEVIIREAAPLTP
ncbi:MAG: hypothetical protein AAB421_01825 [Patescibacteria group bacterium]